MKKKWWITGAALGVLALGATGIGATVAAHKSAAKAAATTPGIVFVDPPKLPGVDENRALADTKSRPQDAAAWVALGDVQLRKRKFTEAEASYVKALALDPKRSETWSALGEARMQTQPAEGAKMPSGAAEAFGRALALDPNDLRARFYRAMEHDFEGEHDAAIGEWLALLRVAPMGSDADESIRSAIVASVRRNQKLIIDAMQKATAVQPRYRQRGPNGGPGQTQ